jgi:translation initiation factor IF-3
MRVSETIGDHDMAIKVKKVREFLGKQYQVRVFMNNFKDAKKAKESLDSLHDQVEDVSAVMDMPRIKGRKITLHLGPKAPE